MGKIRAIRASALARVTLFLIAIAGVFPQHIAAQTPTPAQLETFRNLPPDQQRALMEAMGVGGGSAVRRDPQLSTTDSAAAQQQALRARVSSPADFGPAKMAPGSTVLLDVNLRHEVQARELAKAAVAGQNQSAGQAQAPSQRQGALSQADLLSSAEITPPDPDRLKLLTDRRDRIRQGNPYRLDEQGRIALPVGPPVNLTGLTDLQAAQLLNADPRLDGLHFVVTLLPVEPTGSEGLKPFGYDLFDQPPSTFAPAADIPVPSDYRIGPGDNVNIELFGKRTGRYLLVVDRSGALTLPEFGPIQVSGLSFDAMREEIEQRVAEQMIGVRASVTMGQLRTIRVFVVGDVVSPGSYVVSGLSSITNALFASGGVSSIGSLRNIELKRSGKTIARLDLYDLLLRGDTSQDRQLQQGDAIFVPPVGSTAGIGGQVRRPAIYELRGAATVADLIELAGGLKPEADSRLVRLERIDASRERTVLTLDLSKPGDRSHALMPGDLLTIPQVLDDTRGV
ncbi:MAG TPA: polysaccharide biosynthesis/export family protein, partial [Steroidobacter sp.]|nr:polysaccharide biosynthesis/export family protein [Steroidobacter sp.]